MKELLSILAAVGSLVSFAAVHELQLNFTTTTPSASLPAFWLTWADAKTFAQGLIKTATDATAAAKTAAEAVDANTRARRLANQGVVNDTAKLEALDYENTKAQLNTAIGAQTAVVINTCGSL